MTRSIRLLAIVLLGALLAACGGGGGSGSSTGASPTSGGNPQTGTVTLSLSDAVIDEFDQVLMTIREIRFLSDGGQDILVLEDPVTVDFLRLENYSEFLLRREVVAGTYSKIRLILDSLKLVKVDENGLVVSEEDVRLNGLQKIDINPRGPFTVAAGQELLVDLEVDLAKSIHLVSAGNSGQFRFRPVVFASIYTRDAWDKMFRVEGEVWEVDETAGTFTVCDIRRSISGTGPRPADVCVTVDADPPPPYPAPPYFFNNNGDLTPDENGIAEEEHVVVYGQFPTPDLMIPVVVASGPGFQTHKGLGASEYRPLNPPIDGAAGEFDLGDFGVSTDTCEIDQTPLRVELALGAPAFVETAGEDLLDPEGNPGEPAVARVNDLSQLSLICRRAEAEGIYDEGDPHLRAFILLLGDSQQGVVEYAGSLSEKVDEALDDVEGDYNLDVASPGVDQVVFVSEATRIVRIQDGDSPEDAQVTEDVLLEALPDNDPPGESVLATVWGLPGDNPGEINASFILLDETSTAP